MPASHVMERLSATLARLLAAEGLTLELGKGQVVGRWLVAEPVEAAFAPPDRPLPSPAFPPATLDGEGWRPHEEGDTFLTYLRGLNDDRQVVLAACGIVVQHDTRVVVRLYSKKDIKVWLNGEVVFVGYPDIKAIDELFFATLRPGLNIFVVEKLATSLKFTVEEAARSLHAMSAYLSPAWLDRTAAEIRMVPERLLGAGERFSCLPLPRDRTEGAAAEYEVRAMAPGGDCLWRGRMPAGHSFTVEVPGYQGPLELVLDGAGGPAWGRRFVLVGDVERQIEHLRALLDERRHWLAPRAAEDAAAWLADMEDIWRTQESAAYEPRRWFTEEVDALCDAMGRIADLLGGDFPPDGTAVEDALARGLVLHSFRSRLDGTRQPYYAYIPASCGEDRAHPVVILLKYLYKKVQLPGFAFNPALAAEADRLGAVFLCPFGRGINRYEYAGETDLFEALADLSSRYRLDLGRVFLAGFSMGGGAAWTLLQKHPDRFAGAVGWSCNIARPYMSNLSGKRLAYLSGARDTMFDYDANHMALDRLAGSGAAEVVINRRLAGGHHFSLFNIYNDVRLAEWASAPAIAGEPASGGFRTDDLHYRDAGWAEVVEAVVPGEACEVSFTREAGRLDVTARNVERLRLRASAEAVAVNGVPVGGASDIAGIGAGRPVPVQPCEEDLNATGSGLAEIYYGPVTVVEGDWRGDRSDPAEKWPRRLARALARPVYYGDFREKYAEIAVVPASACELTELERRNLVLVGNRTDNRWLRHLERFAMAGRLTDDLAAAVGRPICAMIYKSPGFIPGMRAVVAMIEDGAGLSAFAETPLFKGQFTPPFTGEPDPMRHDALVLCRDGSIWAARFGARWTLAHIEPASLGAKS